jgi:uncharacterized membrane protein
LAFALIGMGAVFLVAVAMPPLQGPDEPRHVMRAWQIGHGGMIGERLKENIAGGWVDPVILDLVSDVQPWIEAPAASPAPLVIARAAKMTWGAPLMRRSFPDTAIYPPLFYLPAAAAIRTGEAMGLPVVPTLMLARIAQGVATVGLGSLALALAGSTAPWLFVLLTLPMTLSLAGTCSPDGLTIATAALAAALLGRIACGGGEEEAGRRHMLATLALAAVAMTRPPYLLLGLLLLLPPELSRRRRWASFGLVAFCTLGWFAFARIHAAVEYGLPGASVHGQAIFLLQAPWRLGPILIHTWSEQAGNLLDSAIGILGWLNMPLSADYIAAAEAMLVLGAVLAARGVSGPGLPQAAPGPARRCAAFALAAIGLSCLALGITVYLVWTPVGLDRVQGLQGRYFLPIAAFAPLLFPGLGRRDGRGFPAPLRAATLALPIAFTLPTLIAMLDAIAARY